MIPAPTSADHRLLHTATIRKNTTWYRISEPGHPSPLYFCTDQSGRWNSPGGEFGVCYVAGTVEAAFAETFGRRIMGSHPVGKPKIMSEKKLASRHLYSITAQATLYVGEMYGKGLARLSLDNMINTTHNYTHVHPWSAWVHAHPKPLHGLRYQCCHLSDALCCGLFDHSEALLAVENQGPLDRWRCPRAGRSIDDIVEEQGWLMS